MLKILIVEDEGIVALNMQRSLERMGYAVTAVVSSGEAAIAESERIRPDLVLLDIRLEGSVDGVAAAEQIRTRFDIPVVYLTAHADEETLQRAKVTQPYGYLIKPFREEELRTSIEIATYTHQMQQKLRDSERRAATLLKSIGDGVIATDVDGLITYMNPMAEALTGWMENEAIGRDVAEVFKILYERTQAPVENPVAAALEAGETGSLADHTVLVTRDEGSMPIDHSAAPIRDGRGETTGIVFVFRDITDRKRWEEALQSHARQQEALFQLSADLTATLDGAKICQRVVRGLHQKLGYDYLGLFLVDEATGDRVLRASIGWPDAPAQWRLTTGQGLSERPLLDGQLHYTPDVRQDPRYLRGIEGRSEVDVPLRIDEKVRGVLVVESREVDAFDQNDFAVLTAAANQAATALERAREHQAAKAAEVRYQSLFDRVPVELYRTTPAGQFLDANPALVEMLGYPDRESLLATNASDLYVNVEDRQRWQAVLEREGLVRDYDSTIRRFDGSIIWARDDCRAVRDAEEQVLYYEGSLQDITERERAEEALAESELKYRTLFEASTDGIFFETPEGSILDCNRSACSMLGYSKEELIELTVADLMPKDAVVTLRGVGPQEVRLAAADLIAANGTASLPEAVYEHFAGGGLYFETANKRKGGQSIPVEVSARLVSVGGVQRAITFVRDISDRKQAEKALQESEAKYRSLIEQSLQGIMIVQGPPVQIVFANPASGQMLGLTPKEMTSLPANEVEGLIPPDDREALLQRFSDLVEGGPSSSRQIRLTHRDGATRWLETSSRRIEYEGKPALQVAMVDTTERRQAEEALRRRAEELEALQATVLDITMAHDLPTLLLTIVERAARLLDAPMGGLYLCEPDQDQVRCVVSHNTPRDYRGTALRYGEGAAGTAAQTGQSLIIDDYSTWDGRASVFEEDQPFSAVLAMPMIWQGEVIGVIDAVRYAGDRPFTADDLELFALLANHAAIAVENTRLYEQAQKELAERRRLEQQSEERRSYLESLLACAPDAIVTMDTQHRVLEWNPGAEQLFGYSSAEAVGQDLDRMIAAPDARMFKQAVSFTRQALDGEPVPPTETVRYRKDGTPVDVILAGSPFFIAGRLTGTVAVYTDITERRQAEEELRRLKEFNESIVQNVTEGIVLQDTELSFTFVNPAAAAQLGYTPEELLGQHWTVVVPPDQQPFIQAADERRIRGEADRYEVELLRKDGTRIPVLISGSPRFDADTGHVVGTLAVFTDISARIQAEEKLAHHAQEIAALYETLLEINAQPDLPTLLQAIVRRAARLLGAPMGGLYLMRPEDETLELVISHNLPGDYVGTRLRVGEGLSGRVAQTGKPVLVPNYREWEGRAAIYADGPFRRVLGVPLRSGDDVIGVINITDDEQAEPFDAEDIRLVSLFADQAAIAMENARLLEAEARRRREAETLQAATQALTATLDLPRVFELILRELRQVVPYDSASVQQLKGDWLEIIGGHGFPNLEEIVGIRFHLKARDNPNREVVRTRAPLILEDAPSVYEAFKRDPHAPAGIRSWLGVPLLFGDRLIGMIALDTREPGFYTEDHARLVMAFAAQAAIAIENARLFQAEREQRELADRLRETALLVNSSLDLQEVLELILDQLARVLPYDSGSVQIIEPDAARVLAARNLPDVALGHRYTLEQYGYNRRLTQAQEPIVIQDVREDDHGWLPSEGLEHVRSNIGVPLKVRDRVIGLLTIDGRQPGAYDEADARVAQVFAQQAAIAIENARLFEAEREQHELAEALRQATAAVSSTLDLDQVLDHILEQVSRVIPADAANVTLIEDGYAHIVRWRGYERFGQDVQSVALRVADTSSLRHMRQTGETLIIPDTAMYADWVDWPEVDWIRSYIGAPIRVRDEVIGFLNVDSATPGFFEAAHADQLRAFADQASLALGNARLFEETRRRAEQMATLNRIGLAITSDLDLEEVLNTLYEQIERIVDVGAFYVALYDEETGLIHFPLLTGMTGPGEIDPLHMDRNPGLTGYTIRSGKPLYIADTRNVSPGEPFSPIPLIDSPARSYIGVPLIFREHTIGALSIQSYEPNAYTEADLELLTTIATQATVAIENARLHSETQKRLQEQIALREAGAAISSALDRETVLTRIAEQMGQALEASSAYISSYDPETMMSTVLAEYIGPHACAAEAVSDLGVAYPEDGDADWLELMQAGHHDVSHLDSAHTLDSERAHMHRYGAKTILYIPLRIRERLIGYVELWESRRRREFTAEEIALCQDIAQQAAIALENARLYEQAQQEIAERRRGEQVIRQRNRELALLNRVIAASVASSNMETILETVCRELALAFDVPQSAAALLNPEQTEATVIAEYLAEDRPSALGEIIPVEGNPSMHFLLEQKAPLVVEDAQSDPRLAPIHDMERRRGTMSLLILPLVVEGEVIGSLGLDAIEPRAFTDEEVELARRAADQVSSVLARIRLEETQRRLSTAVEQAADGVVITDTKGTILYVNPALERITGYGRAEIIGQTPPVLRGSRLEGTFHQDLWQTVTRGDVWQERLNGVREDGTSYALDLTVSPVRNQAGEIATYVGTMRDVTREVQLEEQFQQAQKMEALGRLAGGIAHDFNNLLTVIRLSIRLLDRQLRPEDPLWEHVRRLEETSERAVQLTKQLLSFSRREIIEPQVLDLNGVVQDLNRMLQRIMGEDIELETRLTEDLWPIKIDPTQIEQVIMNLIVNARDAMPSGGTMTIETANVMLDEVYAATQMDLQAGEYVRLSIRDTGIGMSEEVRAHLFEPFFTTKERGQGTGLGLPTVFGIVKQNEGHVEVDSDVGQGTTFGIYLPRSSEAKAASVTQSPIRPISPIRGTETILVVEDEQAVLDLAVRVLTSCGYKTLAASNGDKALELSEQHDGPIHLLLTDVILPQINGKELADRLRRQRPEIRVLYMSGYTDDAITHHGILAPGTVLLSKPFTVEHLAAKMRAVLDSPE